MYNVYQHQSVVDADTTLNTILNVINEGVWDWDGCRQKVTRSPGWYRMLGYDVGAFREDVFTWENVIHPEDYARVMHQFEAYITGKINIYEVEYRCKKSDGSYLWIIDRGIIAARNPDGTVARMIGAHQDVHQKIVAQNELIKKNKLLTEGNLSLEQLVEQKTQELAKKNKLLEQKLIEIESISNIDPLTQIANRKFFECELEKEIIRANRYHHPLTLVMFDLDNFKDINDIHGHKVGDAILCRVCELVTCNIRDVDLFARWGGDEFVIIFPELTKTQAHQTSEKLRQLISQHQTSMTSAITCSFGVAQYREGDSINTLFQRVDRLLYHSKQKGRNQVYS
ncbi:PAS domain S-box-containing protein/diguanylate cyclase (GGDEF) domain-containing protein [Colwellia chukchiensis]|uniref:diguanylate cyclase n=1 Tax=Colwellia chukchiensis TaxID=641665 RepID=A0A1H7LW74_9GAMM|nr:sensor domain-containing diguanylate cyclase [Colwellia chukchiensis]SEL03152.1 PAS domain S-box-containing protein/diguanylate cyclase (GGDEF) domain-containing protein [Colwellia chukchiensis]